MCIKDLIDNTFCGPIKTEAITASNLLKAKDNQINDLRLEIAANKTLLDSKQASLDSCLNNMSTSNADLQKQVASLTSQVSVLTQTNTDLTARLDGLLNQAVSSDTIFALLPQASKDKANQSWTKYPTANITYQGRTWGKDKKFYPLDVKTWCLEGQNDTAIIKRVRANSPTAMVSEIIKADPSITAHQACDKAVMRIANAFYKPYNFDIDTWGVDEFWQFPSEMEYGPAGDCEDSANWRYIGWRLAGIPKELLRVTAGMTYGGEGHATNYYLASDLKWHHINSTSVFSNGDDVLTKCKTTGDPTDKMGIQFPWFSMTEEKAFSTFGTGAASSDPRHNLKDNRFFRNLRILPDEG
jgi:predicted transglutaminase-like cysteine proteinase